MAGPKAPAEVQLAQLDEVGPCGLMKRCMASLEDHSCLPVVSWGNYVDKMLVNMFEL